jgi:SAM-dependent methyltransferase
VSIFGRATPTVAGRGMCNERSAWREGLLAWIGSMREPTGGYRMSEATDANLLSTAFAVLARELLDDLDGLASSERRGLVEYFASCQEASAGTFVDPRIDRSSLTTHDSDYVDAQCTYFSAHALDALGATPPYRIALADAVTAAPGNMSAWLEHRDWSRPWYESNNAMFLLYFLSLEADAPREPAYRAITEALDWLDAAQDPLTGLWGTESGASLLDGVAGAFHLLLFYYFFERPVPRIERIVDSTLALQNGDGLFSPFGGGGSCEDLDAVDILCNARMRTEYRRGDVDEALRRAASGIVACQNGDGGFRWVGSRPYGWPYWFESLRPGSTRPYSLLVMAKRGVKQAIRPKPGTVSYSGIPSMSFAANASDMWSAWFRPLALAEIGDLGLLDDASPYKYRRQPGLGFFSSEVNACFAGLERSDPEEVGLPGDIRERVRNRYSFVAQSLGRGSKVLDVGCGTGWGAAFLASCGACVDAVDLDTASIDEAEARYGSTDCRFATADVTRKGFASGSYDAIALFEVLEHLGASGAASALDQTARLLSPGGTLVGSTPTTRGLGGTSSSRHHFHEYEFSVNELLALLQTFFDYVSLRVLGSRDIVFVCRGPIGQAEPRDLRSASMDQRVRHEAALFYLDLSKASLADRRYRHGWMAARAASNQCPGCPAARRAALRSALAGTVSALRRPGTAGILWWMQVRRLTRRAASLVGRPTQHLTDPRGRS